MFISVITILIAITVHEFAHAWAADQLGDPTAKFEGRMTLNPLAHLDPIGTIALFIAGFGWGKPVPVDTYNLRSPKRDGALIALAGPLSNIILVLILALVFQLIPVSPVLTNFIAQLMAINLGLAFFNLIPLHPLDGSKIFLGLLPFEQSEIAEDFLRRNSLPILLVSLLPLLNGRSLISLVLFPLINFLLRFFL